MQSLDNKALYSVTKETPNASNVPSYIAAGINEDIQLVDVVYKTTAKGNEFLAFNFENKAKNKLSLTEWPKNLNKPIEQMNSTEKEVIFAIAEAQHMRIKQIVETFTGLDTFEVEASSFKELAEKTIAFLGDKFKGKLVRIKAVYDNKGFVTLPNKIGQAKYTFIESMSVPKDLSKIHILPGDTMERPVRKDAEQIEINPMEVPSTPTKDSKDDLPF